ncbi:MAG: hypothetical protein ACO25B_08965 [Chitinophagaceae bacterium]
MKICRSLRVFFFLCLTTGIKAQGQTAGIQPDLYYTLTNEASGEGQFLNYSTVERTFNVSGRSEYWRFVPEYGNRYRIQILYNGKYWALSADRYAAVKIDKIVPGDPNQVWEVDQLPNASYRFLNAGLKNGNLSMNGLFVDASGNKQLFISRWEEGKTLNGQWILKQASRSNPYYDNDPFVRGNFSMISASTNQSMCVIIKSSLYGGDILTSNVYLSPCTSTQPARLLFTPTINGTYIIQAEQNENGGTKRYLITWDMAFANEVTPDLESMYMFGGMEDTWRIMRMDGERYVISHPRTKEAWTLSQASGNSSTPRAVILGRSGTNPNNQYWYLR